MQTSVKIVNLHIENVKRISAVDITPNSGMNVIGGKNAQGKTSLLDAIAMAIGGNDFKCAKPIKDGADKGVVRFELSDGLTVTRTFTQGGSATGSLVVSSADGARYQSPQALLDGLAGKVSFDPLAFYNLDAKKQAEGLRNLLGLDFSDMDRKRATAYEDRTTVNRQVNSLRERFQALPFYEDAPEEAIDLQDFAQKWEAARDHNAQEPVLRLRAESAARESARAKAEIAELEDQIKRLQAKVEGLRENALMAAEVAEGAAETLAAFDLINTTDLRAEIEAAKTANGKLKANQERDIAAKAYEAAKADADALTATIAKIDDEKSQLLTDAKFPVEGLSFDADGVYYHNIPLSQASGAERLRVSVAIALAMNPKLRVMLIRDGSLLDDDNLHVLEEMAAESGAQVWIERVGEGSEVSVVIEDGQVKGTTLRLSEAA